MRAQSSDREANKQGNCDGSLPINKKRTGWQAPPLQSKKEGRLAASAGELLFGHVIYLFT